MKWYKFNVLEYLQRTKGLADAEDLAYRRLLDFYYINERIPVDPEQIVSMVQLDWDCIEPVLKRFFVYTPTGYIDPEIEDDMKKRRHRSTLNRVAGLTGGRGRKKVVDND